MILEIAVFQAISRIGVKACPWRIKLPRRFKNQEGPLEDGIYDALRFFVDF
jgi:hypothetical protein